MPSKTMCRVIRNLYRRDPWEGNLDGRGSILRGGDRVRIEPHRPHAGFPAFHRRVVIVEDAGMAAAPAALHGIGLPGPGRDLGRGVDGHDWGVAPGRRD